MTLYPLTVCVDIDPSLSADVARREAIVFARRMNVAVMWKNQRVTPTDTYPEDFPPSPKPQKPPVEAVSGWETTGIAWGDYDG